jgi:hypothetical protein
MAFDLEKITDQFNGAVSDKILPYVEKYWWVIFAPLLYFAAKILHIF